MQVARKKKNKHFKWAKKVDPKSLFSLIFPIISFLPSPFLTSLILTFLTSGFFASILFCIFHWNTYYRSPHSIPVNLPILNASSLKVYCVYFISFVSHFKCLILNKWLWSKELAYLFGATKMHGGTINQRILAWIILKGLTTYFVYLIPSLFQQDSCLACNVYPPTWHVSLNSHFSSKWQILAS